MRRLLHGVILWSSCVVSGASAQEMRWRPVTEHLPRPPVATLGAPRPVSSAAAPTSAIRAVAYKPAERAPVVRAASAVEEPRTFWGRFSPAPVPGVLPAVPEEPVAVPAPLAANGGLGLGPESAAPWLYFRGEYLFGWIKDSTYPPLLTTSPPASQGILGQPGTTILFGGDDVSNELRSGGRFTVGLWCDEKGTTALEGSYFFLGERSVQAIAGSAAFPVLGRPFFSLNDNQESAQRATFPGVSTGTVNFEAPSRLWGLEGNFRHKLCCGCLGRLDLLVGARHLELDEGMHITENLQADPTAPTFPGSRILVSDRFDTRNQFWGGQVGLSAEVRRGPWFVDVTGKVALGTTHQEATVGGNQVVQPPGGAPVAFTGGLLALPSNIGHYTRDRFAVVPEVGVRLGWDVTEGWRLFLGYNFLYWSSVVRPGDQIDRVLDVRQVPNFRPDAPAPNQLRPLVYMRDTDFWAQGLTFGMEFRY